MPYITSTRKRALVGQAPHNVGELTFKLQQTIKQYLDARGELAYQYIAEVSGALHQTQRDFDERIVAPYEAAKRRMNGDVW